MSIHISKQFRVEGRVQGVFYRATTQRKAQSLGLTGFASNEADGSVCVCVAGSPEAVQKLKDWLWKGPPACKVTAVIEEPCEQQAYTDFTTR